jgi:hypothetical protein
MASEALGVGVTKTEETLADGRAVRASSARAISASRELTAC